MGAIADQTARKLTEEGMGKMFCLAGIGGRVSGIMKSTEAASIILVIDGASSTVQNTALSTPDFRRSSISVLAT